MAPPASQSPSRHTRAPPPRPWFGPACPSVTPPQVQGRADRHQVLHRRPARAPPAYTRVAATGMPAPLGLSNLVGRLGPRRPTVPPHATPSCAVGPDRPRRMAASPHGAGASRRSRSRLPKAPHPAVKVDERG
ncbi:unnamed protein product [Urochloa humidicola]